MVLDIYAPESVKNADVKYVPITGVPDIDMTSLDKLASETVKIQDNKIKNIEDNYNAIMDLKDKLTGIVPDTEYNAQRLKDITSKAGIGDDFYNMSADELRDPFMVRDKKNKLSNVMNNPEVQSIAKNAVKLQDAMNEVKRLEVKNPDMAKVAKRDLTRIKTDKEGKYDANSFDAKDYIPVDFSTLMFEELKKLPKEYKIEATNDGKGYVIFNKKTNYRMSVEEFAQDIVKKYGDDVNVKNTLISQVDKNKPLDEQQIEDEDAIDNFLEAEALKAFDMYNGITVETDVKEDKVLIDNIETRNNILEGQLKGTGKGGGSSSSTKKVSDYTVANYGQNGAALAKTLIDKGYDFDEIDLVNINTKIEKEGWKMDVDGTGYNPKDGRYYFKIIKGKKGEPGYKSYAKGFNPVSYSGVKYSEANLDMKGLETFQGLMFNKEAKGPDELYGDAEKQDTFKNIKVSEMTLQEVMDFTQHGGAYSNYVKSTNPKGKASTPVGKYQFVGTTLKDLVEDLRLDPNQKFDENLQNYLAVSYAKKRFHGNCPGGEMDCKIKQLKEAWEGFERIPDKEMIKMVKEIEGYKLQKPGKTTAPAAAPTNKSGKNWSRKSTANQNVGRNVSNLEINTSDMEVFS